MAGTSEIYEDSKGEFRYRLESGNGVVVATGEGYKTKAGAKSGIEAVHPCCREREGRRRDRLTPSTPPESPGFRAGPTMRTCIYEGAAVRLRLAHN
jgi:uncharacterized protein